MWSMIWVFLLSIVITCVVVMVVVTRPRSISTEQKLPLSEKEKRFRREIGALVDRHIEALARQRSRLIKTDHYGLIDTSEWDAEMEYFIDKVLFPEMVASEIFDSVRSHINSTTIAHAKKTFNHILREIVEEKARVRAITLEADLSFPKAITPHDFEQWCAKTLNGHGWHATATKASGDQGADVIAEKTGLRIVLQCKLYSGTVGNKAVQEAYTAQRHYAANASAVVTNGAYSPSARDVARTTGVLLLHYSDLTRLDSLLDANGNHLISG
jgi:restriction system protein